MFNLCKLTLRCMQSSTTNTIIRITSYSSARPTVAIQTTLETTSVNGGNSEDFKQNDVQPIPSDKELKNTGLVAAVFAALKDEHKEPAQHKPNFTDKRINSAQTVDDLLSITNEIISKQNALKIVSTLSQWSTSGKVQLSEIENDPRFTKLCRILIKGFNNKVRVLRSNYKNDDLSTVMGVTGDDEAAKLIASITVPQMIKVLSSLAQKKRRSTPLLQSLAYNLSRSTSKLDIKQCADILYCMTVLNFPESVLLERLSNEICDNLQSVIDKSAVIGSLLTSFGLLRYRDTDLLENICEWTVKHHNICRPQDILALFQTLAVLNYHPANSDNLYEILIPMLNIIDMPKRSAWIDAVWSLLLLNQANSTHISSVLNEEFIKKIEQETTMSTSIKLLNINAAAKLLMPNYTGPILNKLSKIHSIDILRTKGKEILVTSILDSLKSLMSSDIYLKKNISTGMGFLIDGECIIDKKCNPVSIANFDSSPNKIRVAIMAYDYHDMCRGCNLPHGSNVFITRLLEAQGYKLMIVPYTDFNPRDKLVQRVQYLEKQLKFIANSA